MKHIRISIFLISLLISVTSHVVLFGAGFVPVRNFDRHTYGGGTQNWDFIQDNLGRAYIGNRDGMLVFDGVKWQKYYIGNYTSVRSLYFDPKTYKIYAGGSGEFGYFASAENSGKLKYTSLSDKVDRKQKFTDIWNILSVDGDIWFQSDFTMFRYNGKNIKSYPAGGRISRTAVMDHQLILGTEDGSLKRFNGKSFSQMPGAGPTGHKITAILPGGQTGALIIATSVAGLFKYDNGNVLPFESDINAFLKENQVFSATERNGNYVFGTVDRGAIIKNFATGATSYINQDGGMQNNTVLAVSFDRDGNLWLCLDNGIDYALFNSPLSTLIGSSNSIGAGYSSLRSGSQVYFGTNQGLYSTTYPFDSSPGPLQTTRLLRGQIWSVTSSGYGIFASGDAGLFHNDGGNTFSQVAGINSGTHTALPLPGSKNLALASTYDRFHLLRHSGDGWRDLGPVDGYDDINGGFVFDDKGYIWFSHFRKGVYRLKLDTLSRRFVEVKLFSDKDGLPGNFDNSVSIIGGKAVISTDDGFYRLNEQSQHLEYDKSLNQQLPVKSRSKLLPIENGHIMIFSDSRLELASSASDGWISLDSSMRIGISDLLISGAENAAYIDSDKMIVSNQEGFWSINPNWKGTLVTEHKPFVNSIYANRDSLIYTAPPGQHKDETLVIPYDLNSLRFEFGYTDFTEIGGVEFSSWLENYDEKWSPFSSEVSREYTRIPNGHYIFHLRVRDRVTGKITESTFELRVLPPWYKSTAACIIYIILFFALAYAGWRYFRLWMKRSRQKIEERKEKELEELRNKAEREALQKDYEIAALKSEQLEHDIKHKSSELSNTTMNLIRKNEILNDISSKLNKIHSQMEAEDTSPVLMRQLKKIQSQIRENISHDDDWKDFTRNFDIVYANYTKRLMELHPNLSSSDQRLCCYIRMHLSSKEIAPLVNISYKSVEMARYRLRKKMGLPADVSLTDYLLNLCPPEIHETDNTGGVSS